MTTLSTLPDRAMQLANQVGTGLKDAVPDKAIKWIETGAALGALKTGSRVATRFIRRNPVAAVAAAAGAGLLLYAARRRAKQAERDDAIEGRSTRVDARRAPAGRRNRSSATRSRRKASTSDDS